MFSTKENELESIEGEQRVNKNQHHHDVLALHSRRVPFSTLVGAQRSSSTTHNQLGRVEVAGRGRATF